MAQPPVSDILRLSQQQIDDPAAADVFVRPAAVCQDVGVIAAGLLQRVGEDRHQVEAPLVVDRAGQLFGGAAVPRPPRRIDPDGAERVAEDFAEDVREIALQLWVTLASNLERRLPCRYLCRCPNDTSGLFSKTDAGRI